jgi:hypothetical protein
MAELEREKAHEGLSRAEQILHEAQEFFRPDEKVRAVSTLAVSLLEGALGGGKAAARREPSSPPAGGAHAGELQIAGRVMQRIMAALGPYRSLLSHLFVRAGVVADPDGMVRFEAAAWYPYKIVAMFETAESREAFGPHCAYDIGRVWAHAVLESARVPRGLSLSQSSLERTESALLAMVRVDGETLDRHEPPARYALGYRRFERIGLGCIEVAAAGPIGCMTTRGYLTGAAEYFHESAVIEHLDGCKEAGGEQCRYLLRWIET